MFPGAAAVAVFPLRPAPLSLEAPCPMATPRLTAPLLPFAAPALTLSERLDVFRAQGHLLDDTEVDLSLGRRWVDKLKAMPPFDQLPHLWERFLAANQLTEDA